MLGLKNLLLLALLATAPAFPTHSNVYLDSQGVFQIESPLGSGYEENSVGYFPADSQTMSRLANRLEIPAMEENTLNDEDEAFTPHDFPLGVPDEERDVPGEPLTPLDFENAEKLELLVPPQDENSPDPLEVAGLFEGDIAGVNASDVIQILEVSSSISRRALRRTGAPPKHFRSLYKLSTDSIKERNAIKNLNKRWFRGVVPYVISASFNAYERSVIAAAFLDYHRSTCIRFVPRTTQQDYVYLQKGAGCSSEVGRSGRGQQISLGPGCLYKGIVVHELMHAMGFWHEQSRGDRDEYVSVLWHNIQRGMEHNFQKFSWNVMQTLGMPYDIGSVMHYGMYAFSKDRRSPTIVPRKPGVQLLGQRQGFSKIDLQKMNSLYECGRGDVVNPKPPAPIRPIKPNVCSDNNRYCRYWARIGECQKNPTWMFVNCASSCEECGRSCSNYNNLCPRWAALGECIKNPDYMVIYCPGACHACSAGSAEVDDCIDKNKYCVAWANTGQCQANPTYMLRHCKKSCRQC